MTHWSSDVVAPSTRDNVGMATLRLEFPTNTISRLRQRTARIFQRRSYVVGSALPPAVMAASAKSAAGSDGIYATYWHVCHLATVAIATCDKMSSEALRSGQWDSAPSTAFVNGRRSERATT